LVVMRAVGQCPVGVIIEDATIVYQRHKGEHAHSAVRVGTPSRLLTKRREA
jgi:hypothetical protein